MSIKYHEFTENFYEIKHKNPWSYGSFHAFAALIYALNQKNYDKESFMAVKKEFQSQIGWTALFNASVDDLLFALLSTTNEKGPGIMAVLTDQSRRVKANLKFPVAQIHYSLYLVSHLDEAERAMILKLAKETYTQVRRNHPLLSSPNDLPLYVSLLTKVRNVADATIKIERIYNELITRGFSKSGNLLSASISLSELPLASSEIGERGKLILTNLKSLKLSKNSDIYGFLPILMQREVHSSLTYQKLKETFDEIQQTKSIKWLSKQEKMLIAISLNMMDLNQHENYSKSSLEIYNLIERHIFVQYYKNVQAANASAAV